MAKKLSIRTLGQHRRAKAYLKDALTLAGEIQFLPLIIDGLISVAGLLAKGLINSRPSIS